MVIYQPIVKCKESGKYIRKEFQEIEQYRLELFETKNKAIKGIVDHIDSMIWWLIEGDEYPKVKWSRDGLLFECTLTLQDSIIQYWANIDKVIVH